MALDSYSKARAMELEDDYIAGHAKLYGNKKKTGRFLTGDFHKERLELAERRKLVILSLCTDEFQGTQAIADKIGLPCSSTRQRIIKLIKDGRLESQKTKGKIYVRLPQEEQEQSK